MHEPPPLFSMWAIYLAHTYALPATPVVLCFACFVLLCFPCFHALLSFVLCLSLKEVWKIIRKTP